MPIPESSTPEDFERVGNLLGDACEAAADSAPEGGQGASETTAPNVEPSAPAPSGPQPSPGEVARLIASAWPEIVGEEIAANTSAVQVKGGRLVVSTSSSVWAHTLQYMSQDLIIRLNERLGSEAVTEITFRHAGWEERPSRSKSARSPKRPSKKVGLTQEEKQALAQIDELDLPADVKEKMTRAMRAAFTREQGDSVR